MIQCDFFQRLQRVFCASLVNIFMGGMATSHAESHQIIFRESKHFFHPIGTIKFPWKRRDDNRGNMCFDSRDIEAWPACAMGGKNMCTRNPRSLLQCICKMLIFTKTSPLLALPNHILFWTWSQIKHDTTRWQKLSSIKKYALRPQVIL